MGTLKQIREAGTLSDASLSQKASQASSERAEFLRGKGWAGNVENIPNAYTAEQARRKKKGIKIETSFLDDGLG